MLMFKSLTVEMTATQSASHLPVEAASTSHCFQSYQKHQSSQQKTGSTVSC